MQDTNIDVKLAARETIDQLPDGATWDDVMYRIYVRQKIDAGMRDVENGDTVTNAEVRRRFGTGVTPRRAGAGEL